MKKLIMLTISILLVSSVGVLTTSSSAIGLTSTSISGALKKESFSFAYTDKTGKRLLAFGNSNPSQLTQAISSPGDLSAVKYMKHQTSRKDSNGRQTMWNFAQDEGDLFHLYRGKLKGNDSIILATKDAFQGHQFLQYTPLKQGSFSKSVVSAIEKTKKRKIVKQGLIGKATAIQIGLVEFERKSGKPLASIVMATKDGLIFEDLPGNNDEQSTWRVDDGGVIEPSMFTILFVTQSESGYSLGFEWIGVEGHYLKLIQQQADKFRTILEGSRYTAPV
ncbi:MAG TPA: hypothetical protein VGI33_01685 [Paenibacillus sp.]|jgi:hypothetical protein